MPTLMSVMPPAQVTSVLLCGSPEAPKVVVNAVPPFGLKKIVLVPPPPMLNEPVKISVPLTITWKVSVQQLTASRLA